MVLAQLDAIHCVILVLKAMTCVTSWRQHCEYGVGRAAYITAGLTKGQKVLHVPAIFEAASGAALHADDLQIMESVVVGWLHMAKDVLSAKSEDFTLPVSSLHCFQCIPTTLAGCTWPQCAQHHTCLFCICS